MTDIENAICEGNILDGHIVSVNVNTKHFDVKIQNQDFGNGNQETIHTYHRTKRIKDGLVVFFSNTDWDR